MKALITFGMIVLNGEPFLQYNLQALYPFAHQIIIVEGAAPGAAAIASLDGHSTDDTLETLYDFKKHCDPQKKVIIVKAEDEGHPNGFWPGEKDEQSQAFAKRATGNYLWQVDVDEFYRSKDMQTIINLLEQDSEITAVSFKMLTFWGGFDYLCDGWYLRRGADIYHRLFKWGPGYQYSTHRPPTVLDPTGIDLRTKKWISGDLLKEKGIFLYHYSLVFPDQVTDKCTYYQNADWAKRTGALKWAKESFFSLQKPYRVHNVYQYPSWLKRFKGSHPEAISSLILDIKEKHLKIETRKTDDVEKIIDSPLYNAGIQCLKIGQHFDTWIRILKSRGRKIYRRVTER